MYQDFDDAICLLGLVFQRTLDLQKSTQELEIEDTHSESERDLHEENLDDPDNPTVLDTNSKDEQCLFALKSQVLHRLVEILAETTFKTKTNKTASRMEAPKDPQPFGSASDSHSRSHHLVIYWGVWLEYDSGDARSG